MSSKFISLDKLSTIRDWVKNKLTGKLDKVQNPTQYNVPIFDSNGNLTDSGISMQDRATMRGWNDSSGFGSFIEQAQGSSNQQSFGFTNTTDPDVLYWETSADGKSIYKHVPTKKYVDDKIAIAATDTTAGTIKLNSGKSITTNEQGQLEVGGRMGQFSETTGLFAPNDRDPRRVGDYSLLMTDAIGVNMTANRAMAIVSGLGVSCISAPAGSTVYRLTNNYTNRIVAKCCEDGFISLSEASSKEARIVPVVSVLINGKTFTPNSAPNNSNLPIEITVQETVNPTSATTSIRLFGAMKSYASAHIGNGVASWASGRSLMIGGGITKADGNDNCMIGLNLYSSGNGNAMFGRNHIAVKNRSLLAGTGHDTTNAKTEAVVAVGEYSLLTSDTLFAVGNGSSHIDRKNAFEVTSDGGIVLRSPNGTRYKITVSNTGAITATAI